MTIMGSLELVARGVPICLQGDLYECHRPFTFRFCLSPQKKKECSNSLSMSTDPFTFQTPYHRNARSNNDMYMTPGFSQSLDDVSSRSTSTSPVTPLSNSLLSPDNLSFAGQNATGGSFGSFSHGLGAYNQLQYKCHHLECKLLKEREEYKTLRCVPSFFTC